MSEWKKTCGNCAGRIESLIYKDRCDITEEVIEDMSATCDDWEADRETRINSLETNLVAAVSQLAKVNEERDALQAQVAVLRGALERARKGFVNLIDLKLLVYEKYEWATNKLAQSCFEALSTTPSEDAERVQLAMGRVDELERQLQAAVRCADGRCPKECGLDCVYPNSGCGKNKAETCWLEYWRQKAEEEKQSSDVKAGDSLTISALRGRNCELVQERDVALKRMAELTKERDDYVEELREIEQGCGPADNMAQRVLEKWGKSTQ